MIIQPKPEPGSPTGFTSTNPNHNFEQKTIPDLVKILRGTCRVITFDAIEAVLVNRDTRLREEIQHMQNEFELEKSRLRETLQLEELSRIQAEEDVKKREELCEKGKIVQESYESLLKEVKSTELTDRNTIEELRKKNNELECEVKNLKEKCVDDGSKLDVIRRKNAELESEVLELRKTKKKLVEASNEFGLIRRKSAELESEVLELRKKKEKLVEDGNELGVLRKLVVGLENKVSELTKLNEKLIKDNNAFDELRGKFCVLEERVKNQLASISELGEENRKLADEKRKLGEENNKLADEKRKVEIENKLLCKMFRDLRERLSKLEDDAKLWPKVDASDGGNSEGEPRADHMVEDFEDNGGNNEEEPWMNVDVSDGENSKGEPRADLDTDFEDNGEEDDIVEAAPLPRNEDAPHSLGVVASTRLQNIEGNDAQGASSGEKCWKVYTRKPKKTVEMAGSSRVGGRVERDGIEVIDLVDDDDDDVNRSIAQGVHGKTTVFELAAVKDEYPSSSVATQQNSKFTNAVVDTVKRKFPFSEIETSSDDSSSDSSFADEFPISSVVSQGKKTKM